MERTWTDQRARFCIRARTVRVLIHAKVLARPLRRQAWGEWQRLRAVGLLCHSEFRATLLGAPQGPDRQLQSPVWPARVVVGRVAEPPGDSVMQNFSLHSTGFSGASSEQVASRSRWSKLQAQAVQYDFPSKALKSKL